ncbi:unnamed protein product [Adineta steineri]|uniref:G-protein coupled receptors family 1 profile domain-containing protein n=1 Tax=Adineta steineri TaxID=433720 RepID=A0A819F953_9BILA|nr:unnamed protein product [Adineta steineri]
MNPYNNSAEINNLSYKDISFETNIANLIKFIILLIFQLLSICCSLFLFFHLITKPKLRRSLRNHTIITLVIISFFQTISDLPLTLEYLRIGQASSSVFCLLWNFFAFSNYAVGVWVMTWASLERHFLIFHPGLMNTTRGKFFFHYIPLFISLFIPWMYYIAMIFFYPCTNTFYLSALFCGWCCYAYNDALVTFNWLMYGVIPVCLITTLNIWLIIRVVLQKRHVQQQINWRQHRRMTVQLLSVACLYIFFDGPAVIIGIIRLGVPTFAADIQILYLYYIVYFLPLLVPFICLANFRELWNKNRVQVNPLMPLTRTRTVRRTGIVKPTTWIAQTSKV